VKNLTHKYLRKCLTYQKSTGLFIWRERPKCHFKKYHRRNAWNTSNAGKVAGSPDGRGYIRIYINGEKCKAHRLAWFYVTGEKPEGLVDHDDGDGTNNKWRNLNHVTSSGNSKNLAKYKSNTSGVTGVRQERGLWCAYIQGDRLGKGHKNKRDATKERRKAEVERGFSNRHGRKLSTLKRSDVSNQN